jgi:hypothetical protein
MWIDRIVDNLMHFWITRNNITAFHKVVVEREVGHDATSLLY